MNYDSVALIAALPMYDLPELRPHTQALWQAIAGVIGRAGIAAPAVLGQPDDLAAHWRDPAVLLSQTCGYPLLSLPDHVRVVATPVYEAPGCEGPRYRSAIIVHRDAEAGSLSAMRGRVCAINSIDSNSGMNLLRVTVAPLAGKNAFFGDLIVTGSHAASIDAVGRGTADLAAIDCVTFALLRRYRPALVDRVRLLDWTVASPGLPLVTAQGEATRLALRRALTEIATDPAHRETCRALLIEGFVELDRDAYDAVQRLEDDARNAGYPRLA
ncbi:PhnD/SsuA/transferrin family substrate-binding protein [Lichenicola cladoniae]|uniref:PhnD/SsuA/transferrin family substrate-binding protein n=1 Tax=Lichenicola cladoniae TaxID=1484109 RepID=A0A6M8HVB7_9PROT|nr:PhnD/SsuA/transferrin family substrate-binding protein [Lichenicola cladoniae]NPD66231.1 PhnD/SsuA/transferrin family substrate-binding protein [Acetobacteraceae bacterium]QKE92087.1 PhnD/SsuA/transferrin family substrate-binding protein [Lichenicola cladoniae]